jgi:serine/threonine-protein kinase RsbT
MSYKLFFDVEKGDFEKAGEASRKIKKNLKQIGVDNKVIRHIAIAGYEGEMNLAIHSDGGEILMEVDNDKVTLWLEDVGPGIPDVDLAMTEGWSTASDKVREMGFGAGMGLPNMQKNADTFEIESKVGKGTKIKMTFNL